MRAKTPHNRLSTLEPGDFVQWAALPGWVRPALDATRPTTAVPDATLPLTAPDVAGWMRDFVELSGQCDRWYVSTDVLVVFYVEEHEFQAFRRSG